MVSCGCMTAGGAAKAPEKIPDFAQSDAPARL